MDLKSDIEKYLAWKKMKLYQLCDKSGVSYASAYRYMNGERGLAFKTVEKLLDAMKD
ncbi:MAG: helix-turn-helix transcriptional regulator [Nitrospirota bacterium]